MLYKIANVKISLKTSHLFLDNVTSTALENNLYCKSYQNFVVVKSTYTFIIFKSKIGSTENHINITKIPSCCKIEEAVNIFQSLFQCTIRCMTVDNIIATAKLPCGVKVDLLNIAKSKKFASIKYNNELFSGMFIKFPEGTIIIFHSGKFVIVGCKNELDIKCLIQNLCANI
jgi:hypothetical protein